MFKKFLTTGKESRRPNHRCPAQTSNIMTTSNFLHTWNNKFKIIPIYTCETQKTLTYGKGHTSQLTALNQTKCTRAPTERCCNPAEVVVLVGKCVALPGFAEILKARPPAWMQKILAKTNALSTIEGSRLLWQGHTRHIDTCVWFEYLTTQMS